ncbi:MAG: DEAD/DEAH box helicase [Brevundimonas sp.]|uniref:DEAD/DEAH box helicase n=1 Tax=Brevundimonas albigilva TaxID=1312364 RepID=A0ABY4SMQ8_9CAUL|nr:MULTISPECIES: DEAD/DEAH box helicase [Brevundimonas]MCV0416510.1 DEAD/DEAH box helicase [Brevundimonas sp.]URI14986.1 DEAD/DEAH box helicase [Brevundimonas albigilva]
MPSNIDAISAAVRRATEQGFRDQLLAKGQARAMVWRDGRVPDGGPRFARGLSYDLLAYGYSLLTQGLRLLEGDGDHDLARTACAAAAEALEAVVANGPESPEADFHRLMAAGAYHIARYSARAFSLLTPFADAEAGNLAPVERALSLLMLRQLDRLDQLVIDWTTGDRTSDEALARQLADLMPADAWADAEAPDDQDPDDAASDAVVEVADLVLTQGFMVATSEALLALERGERSLLDRALEQFGVGLEDAEALNMVPQWWAHRLARHLFEELWGCSFHNVLPKAGPAGLPDWTSLRDLFIASLHSRSRAEIDLWPSQIDAAARAMAIDENLVVSLPTSAGKTRIAELCILACLSAGKRVMFITPLRALSAQTEVSLIRTFRPLGKTVSGLYGSIGVSGADAGLLMDRDIVVATPEKLDFALRNDPALLDDVGLVVLDEGHTIGLGEREVRYEVQIQRLLRRADADQRRIVCLSAVLPENDQLDDFVAWLSKDHADGLVFKDWRPTRLRFGEVAWSDNGGKLNITLGEETPYIPKFLTPREPPQLGGRGQRRKLFPCDQRELVLATTWRLIEDGQTVLIYCPQRRSVEPFADTIVDLYKRQLLSALIEEDDPRLNKALAIGTEWLGADHPLLQCLRLGVAVHHGALPTPYRREVEALLRDGILKVTVSSPTLAQGLNLSATTLVFQGLRGHSGIVEPHEFRNIVGRAGRAFIDVQGLVLYPMFDKQFSRRRDWTELVNETAGREMESGLLRLILTLLRRMQTKLGTKDAQTLIDYVAGMPQWDFEPVAGETVEEQAQQEDAWNTYVTSLDTALLSMLGEEEVADADIEAALDAALASSLWSRRLARRGEKLQALMRDTLVKRAQYIWANTTARQRRGYFLAGVGLATGHLLDAHGDELIDLLTRANGAIIGRDDELAIDTLTAFADLAFGIPPFAPRKLPPNWRDMLRCWLEGRPMSAFAGDEDSDALQFIEEAFLYRLPWALESVRVYGLAIGYTTAQGFELDDLELGVAAGAVETGVLNRDTIFLIQAGFTSRSGAQIAVADGGGDFESLSDLRAWARTPEVMELTSDPAWPTPETHELWLEFLGGLSPERIATWSRQEHRASVQWLGAAPRPGEALRIKPGSEDEIVDSAYQHIGVLAGWVNAQRSGLLQVTSRDGGVDLVYLGPNDLNAQIL